MSSLIICRGLPASGKTTHALKWLAEDPSTRARVNRDSFRAMFHGHAGTHESKVTEPLITKLAHDAASAYLRAGVDVIVDDTNLRQRTAREWATVAKTAGADLIVEDFTHVTLETCLARNAARVMPVPDDVIRRMHDRYLKGTTLPLPHPEPLDGKGDADGIEPIQHDPDLPNAIIVDIDGTIAKCGDRDIYDGAKAHLDTPHADVIRMVLSAVEEYADWDGPYAQLIVMTGRSEEHRDVTEKWLRCHLDTAAGTTVPVHMRPAGDTRRDATVKLELFNEHVRGRYNVVAVFDDRNQVVDMWRALGLRVYQVAPGNF